MADPKQVPDDPTKFAAFFRERGTGHSPGYDIAVYARPSLWLAVAAALEAKDAEIKRLTAQIEIDGKLIATLQAERDHWSGLVSRADHALFPFALEQRVPQGKE